MPKNISNTDIDQPLPDAPLPAPPRPRLHLPLGRGSRGKSLWAEWAVERARDAGRSVLVADGDRTNQTLAARFDDTLRPTAANDAAMMTWLRGLIERLLTDRTDVLLDLGGGDLLIKRIAAEMDLVSWLADEGADVVAVHLLGPSEEDLAYLGAAEKNQLLAPAATILVLNEGVITGDRDPVDAFATSIRDNDIFARTLDRGAKLVVMPHLGAAPQIETKKLSFAAAETSLTLWDRQVVRLWRRRMEANHASVTKWLP